MKKKPIIILFLTVVTLQVFSQQPNQLEKSRSIRDFFIPNQLTEIAKAIYHGPISTNIYYRSKGDENYEVLFEKRSTSSLISLTLVNVNISKNEVWMSQIRTEGIIQKERTIEFKPSVILLKLPEANRAISWESRSFADEVEKCTAVLTTMMHRGKEYEAIKITKETPDTDIQTIEYYLKGIGLYRVNFFDPKTNEETLVNDFVQVQGS